jgi:hypothetical protein
MSQLTTTEPTEIIDIQTQRDVAAFELIQRQAKMLAASSLVPKDFLGNVANCAIGLNIAHRLKADAFMVIQNIDIIHGRPSFRATFLIAMVNASGRFTPLQFKMSGTGASRACLAHCKDIASGDIIEGPEVSMQMAKAEGWSTKNGSKWVTMPELMLRYRAAAFFARLYAPDITLGMQTAEELRDTEIDVTPKRTVARAVPLDPFTQPAAIEAPAEVQEVAAVEEPELFKQTLYRVEQAETAHALGMALIMCDELINEKERTAAKAAVYKQAIELGLRWDEKTGGFVTQ